MKKSLALIFAIVLIASHLAGCGETKKPNDKITVTATIFPLYDWAREIIGAEADRFDLKFLLDTGVDLHSFQPTVQDISRLSGSDLFLCVGGESDEWAEKALSNAADGLCALKLLEILGENAKTEEVKEGMQAHEEGEEEEEEKDEHIWLSLKTAAICCEAIAEKICRLDPERAEIYRANRDAYLRKLSALDGEFAAAVAAGAKKTLVFGDRFPFRYLTDDYGLEYFAAFSGCSAETEASFNTVVFLAKKADEAGVNAILTIETSDGSVARTVRENTAAKDQAILVLNSLQSTTKKDADAGVTYLSVMRSNLEVLREALR